LRTGSFGAAAGPAAAGAGPAWTGPVAGGAGARITAPTKAAGRLVQMSAGTEPGITIIRP